MATMSWTHEICLFCHVKSPSFSPKHKTTCFFYRSIEPERCAVQHDLFLRGCGGGEPYEYECNFCNMPPVFCDSEIKWPNHPFCRDGRHRWSGTCDSGCCPSQCRCGEKEPTLAVTETQTTPEFLKRYAAQYAALWNKNYREAGGCDPKMFFSDDASVYVAPDGTVTDFKVLGGNHEI